MTDTACAGDQLAPPHFDAWRTTHGPVLGHRRRILREGHHNVVGGNAVDVHLGVLVTQRGERLHASPRQHAPLLARFLPHAIFEKAAACVCGRGLETKGDRPKRSKIIQSI